MTAGLEADDVVRSPTVAASPEVKPKPRGEGSGVVDRLALFTAGLETGTVEVWPATGRDPMGPTDPMGPALGLDKVWWEVGESAPPGDEVDVAV